MVTPTEKKQLRTRGKGLKPVLQIGKNGLSEGTIELLSRELKQNELIKVKFLDAAREQTSKKELAKQVCTATGATLIEQIGNVIVIYKVQSD